MTKSIFTDGWTFGRFEDAIHRAVRLPHDAMLSEPRSAEAPSGNHGAYFGGGVYVYTKQWTVPEGDELQHELYFEGVYGDTVVTVDGREVARSANGFQAFTAPLGSVEPGHPVTIKVTVDNSVMPNARWYTGSGIYRDVWLRSLPNARFARDGVRFVTKKLGVLGEASVEMMFEGVSDGTTVFVELSDVAKVVAAEVSTVQGNRAQVSFTFASPRKWTAEHPFLYKLSARLEDGDATALSVGLRTVSVDPVNGLRINGDSVLLRGACIHSDNGILGAVSLKAAEYRRVRILKEAGYNAVRASHNPASVHFLDACDELGMYVLDELTDVWFKHKTPHDGADRFAETWRPDVDAMVAEDRNRPSVIMYSIGNEIAETSMEEGVAAAQELSDYVRSVDPTRPTTLAVNLLLNMMAKRGSSPFESAQYAGGEKKEKTSTAANAATAKLGSIMQLASRLPAADKASRDAFATVDVAGYNYAYSRYATDRKKYRDRVILGTESMPGDLPEIWKRVTSIPGVIGDFMWTGWDYLGEAGIGVWSYGDEFAGINKPFPALLAGSGAIDITGLPGAPVMLAKAVWDLLGAPAIAVRPLDRAGIKANTTPWRSTDAIASWSWGDSDATAQIEVYSADDHVELILNGRSLGKRRAGSRAKFVARFEVPYKPGELVAVGYRNGAETGRSTLRTSGDVAVRVRSEKSFLQAEDDLAYLWIELADEDFIVDTAAEDQLAISLSGPAELLGFGSAKPSTDEPFTGSHHSTHYGRALIILRTTGEDGDIAVHVETAKFGSADLTLRVETVTAAAGAR